MEDGSVGTFAFNLVCVSNEATLDWESPDAVEAISRATVSYQAETNISGSTFSSSSSSTWLSLTTAGLLSGTAPSVSKTTEYTYAITATSPGGQTATQTVTITVYPVAKLTASSLSVSGTSGTAISTVTITSNLTASLTMSGDLPTGLTWSSSAGTITGTPTETGSFTVTIRGTVTEGPSQTSSIQVSFTITEASLSITSSAPTGVYKTGSSYSYSLSANQDVTWSLSDDAPEWLVISGSTLTGSIPTTYTADTVVAFVITATTAGGQTATQNVSISIEPTLKFTTVPTASCVVTPVYNYNSDGTFSLASLLSGLFGNDVSAAEADVMILGAEAEDAISYTAPDALDAITGATFSYNAAVNITGSTYELVSGESWLTCTTAGVVTATAPSVTVLTTYEFVIRATSPQGQTIDQTITLHVYPVAQLTASARQTTVNQYEAMDSITISSNVTVTYSTTTLPSGVSFDPSTGVLSGEPDTQGTYTITIYGATIAGPSQSASIKVTIVVGEPILTFVSTAPTGLYIVGNSYSYTPETNVSGTTFELSEEVSSYLSIVDGVIVGQIPATFTDAATATYMITATSPDGQTATQTVSITIEPVIEWTTIPTASCIVQPDYTYADDGSFTLSLFMDVSAADDTSSTENTAITETGTRTFKFVWTGENAETVTWDFGDGTTATGYSVIHTYEENGTYTYTCTGTNSVGSSTVTGTITVDVDDGIDPLILITIGVGILLLIALIVVAKSRSKSKTKAKPVSGRGRR